MEIAVQNMITEALYDEISGMEGETIYHTSAWHRVLARSFGWRVQALTARDSKGHLIWCLPFVAKRRMGRRINVCLPLSHRVGPVRRPGDTNLPPGFLSRLWPLEIHQDVDLAQLGKTSSYSITAIDLKQHSDEESLWRSTHKNHIQRKIRKARKNELRLMRGAHADHFADFRELQVETRRKQGSPMYPRNFFRHIWEELGPRDMVQLHLVYQGDRPVSGVIFFHFNRIAVYAYGASVNDRSIWRLGANQLVMWSAIQEAYSSGMTMVDLGTTPAHQTDLRKYKERWGGVSEPLYYSFASDSPDIMQINRTNAAIRLSSYALKHMPKAMFARFTPLIMRMVV